jgi:hypothetical protein
VLTNNVAALGALLNGMRPMRKVAAYEAERRHLLELQLRQSGFFDAAEGMFAVKSARFSRPVAVIPPSHEGSTLAPLVSPDGELDDGDLFDDVFHARKGSVSWLGFWAGRRRESRDSWECHCGRGGCRGGAHSRAIDWRRGGLGAAPASS